MRAVLELRSHILQAPLHAVVTNVHDLLAGLNPINDRYAHTKRLRLVIDLFLDAAHVNKAPRLRHVLTQLGEALRLAHLERVPQVGPMAGSQPDRTVPGLRAGVARGVKDEAEPVHAE